MTSYLISACMTMLSVLFDAFLRLICEQLRPEPTVEASNSLSMSR